MNPSLVVREATAGDRPAVLDVVRRAFSDETRDAQEEVDIVERTWALGREARPLELVAVDAGTIVGHVLAAAGTVDTTSLLAVAPLCVAPAHQGRGVGSQLMEELLHAASAARWPAVVLLGSPTYYARFGFEPAANLGLHWEPVGRDNPHFLARRLTGDAVPHGPFRYAWEAVGMRGEQPAAIHDAGQAAFDDGDVDALVDHPFGASDDIT